MKKSWNEGMQELARCLADVSISAGSDTPANTDAGFTRWYELTQQVKTACGQVFMIGNGASASMASHFAADLQKNAGIRARTFTDLSLITAVSNDISYEDVFAEPLRRSSDAGDMLVAISSSGTSPNILKAIATAQDLGLSVVTLSGMRPDNPMRSLGAVRIYAPAPSYGLAETSHAAILHHWLDMLTTD